MEDSFYDNLRRATDNTKDITNEKYATVTKIEGKLASVKEEDSELEHSNVPILNNIRLDLGDKVVIGFVNNSIYNPILIGSLEQKPSSGDDVSWDNIQDKPTSFPPSAHAHSITDVTNLESSLNQKLNVEDAFSGSYNDLSNKPTIPTKTSDLTNDGADGTNVFVANNDSRLSDTRDPKSHAHGQITNAGAITSTAVTVASNDNIVITDYSDSSKIKRVANLLAGHIKDSNAHSNIGSSASATQATINTNIDTALGNKISKSQTSGLIKNDGTVDTTQYLSSLPSHNHDGRYYTESEMDALLNGKLDVEDAFSGSYNDLTNVPSSFTPSAHNHSISDVSNLQTSLNAKLESADVGAAALSNDYYDLDNLPALFDGNYNNLINKPTIPSKTSDLTNDGDGTNVFVKNNDSRLSDARTPTSHTHTKSQITDFPTSMTPTSHTHGNLQNNGQVGSTAQANKNVVTNSSGKITTEDKPTIPSASSTTPSADTASGSYGSGTTYARSNHTHPKSSLYAEATHSHTKSQITDFPALANVATSGSYNDLSDKPNIPSGVVVDLNLDGNSNNAVANSAVVGGLNDKIEASDISFGFDANTKQIYIEVN